MPYKCTCCLILFPLVLELVWWVVDMECDPFMMMFGRPYLALPWLLLALPTGYSCGESKWNFMMEQQDQRMNSQYRTTPVEPYTEMTRAAPPPPRMDDPPQFKVDELPSYAQTQPSFCVECGTKGGGKFCANCGAPAAQPI